MSEKAKPHPQKQEKPEPNEGIREVRIGDLIIPEITSKSVGGFFIALRLKHVWDNTMIVKVQGLDDEDYED